MVPGAVYARQSMTRDGSESIPIQVEACREAAGRLGVEVVGEFIEPASTSGYKHRGRRRREFAKLLSAVRRGEVRAILVYKSERLSRGGGPGWAPVFDALEEAGVDTDRAVATPSGWMSEFEISIRAAMDREESKKLADRMSDVRAREAKAGKPRLTGRRPFGYDLRMTRVDEVEAGWIREAVERVLAGESVWSICRDWVARGVPTVTGSEWTVTTLTSILTSGRIAGLREHRGRVVAEGSWPAIIDQATHERLRAVLAPKRKRASRARRYPLTGLMRCGRCGKPLRSLAREGGKRSYACRSGPGLGGCGGIRVQAEGIEAYVREVVCGMLADPETRAVLASMSGDGADDHDGLVEAMQQVETKRARLVDLYTDGDITRAEFRRRRDELDEEARALDAEIARRSGARRLVDVPASFEELVEAWEARGIEFQRMLVEAVLEPIVVNPAGRVGRKFDPERVEIRPRA